MTIHEAVRAVVYGHAYGVPNFDTLLAEVRLLVGYDAGATEIDAAARPYERGEPGAYRYEMPERPAEE